MLYTTYVTWLGEQDNMKMQEKKYNNVMKIKTFFGVMLIVFFAIIVIGQYYKEVNAKVIENYPFYTTMVSVASLENNAINFLLYDYDVDSNKYSSCVFVPPQEKTIILRLDDVGAWHYLDVVEMITEDSLARNIPISQGVIPNDIERDRSFLNWVKKVRDNPQIEFALHGYYHTENEFEKLNYEESKYYLDKGKQQMIKYMGVVPVTFIPPYNVYSNETEKALIDGGFKIMSAGKDDVNYDGDLIYLGYGARTFDYSEGNYISPEITVQKCKESLDRFGLCVVMVHPQDYLEPEIFGTRIRNLDEQKYADFQRMLDELKGFNTSFKTYKDLLQCA